MFESKTIDFMRTSVPQARKIQPLSGSRGAKRPDELEFIITLGVIVRLKGNLILT
jgi:hypothetical protein